MFKDETRMGAQGMTVWCLPARVQREGGSGWRIAV